MKTLGAAKHFLLAFLLALAGYALFYAGLQHLRTRRGPWQVTFTNTLAGAASMVIDQPRLGITSVQVNFVDQPLALSNSAGRWVFAEPRAVPHEVPFGKCLFMDTTFLPGTVAFQLFGHEIELLPRVLVIDHQEQAWRSGATFELRASTGK